MIDSTAASTTTIASTKPSAGSIEGLVSLVHEANLDFSLPGFNFKFANHLYHYYKKSKASVGFDEIAEQLYQKSQNATATAKELYFLALYCDYSKKAATSLGIVRFGIAPDFYIPKNFHKKDWAKYSNAFSFLEKAIAMGDTQSAVLLCAMKFLKGKDGFTQTKESKEEEDKYIEHLKTATVIHAVAIYFHKSYSQSLVDLLTYASEQGNAQAKGMLAVMNLELADLPAVTVEKPIPAERSLKLLAESSLANFAVASCVLGALNYYGADKFGFECDTKEAVQQYERCQAARKAFPKSAREKFWGDRVQECLNRAREAASASK